jgi:hypothetical protein
MADNVSPEALLVRVASYYSALKARGRELVGACPVCRHGTPTAFFVRPAVGLARCADCGFEGDALALIRAVEGVDERRAKLALKLRKWAPVAEIEPEVKREVRPRRKPPRKPPIRQTCWAFARSTGAPCQAHLVRRPDGSIGKRCRNHGGLSTGPRTSEGRAKCALNLRMTPSWKKSRARKAGE